MTGLARQLTELECGSGKCPLGEHGTVVRALASHQHGPGLIPRVDSKMLAVFVVGSRPCSEGFSPGTPVFLPSQKPTFPYSNST